MIKIFITGGNGFIGRNLVEQLPRYNKYEIHAPSRHELNLLDENQVLQYLKKYQFDVVIHAATQNASRNAKESLGLVLDRNLRMFINLTRCNQYFGKMIYYGSGAEYDMRNYQPLMKEDFFNQHVPVDGYGFSKHIMSTMTNYLDNIIDLRLFGVYGKYEDWEIRFISNAICKVLYDLPISIKQNVFFDYLYIDDLIKITDWFIQKEVKYKHYNICTGATVDLLSISQMVLKESGKNLDITIENEGLRREYSGSNERFISEIKQFEFTKQHVAISRLFDWYRTHISQIDPRRLLLNK